VGFIVNFKMWDYFNLRILPGVSFYDRGILYTFKSGRTEIQNIESAFIEIPVLLKYKSERRGNVRMYILGGFKYGIEAGAKYKERSEDQLRLYNQNYSIEYGLGIDLYYPMFRFSPELRFSHGINNMILPDPNIYSKSIQSLYTHTVTLYLNFQ